MNLIKNENENIPWVEKYRPTELKNIVLEPINRELLNNIINNNNFPNLLFYGPPGTGKTTTIINLINEYNERHGFIGKELIMHLNASDERGVDIIRNQIQNFINTNTLFGHGNKYVILDEVDYMTKTAQIALKNLLLNYKNIRFCLICNYISKIDKSLQEEFIHFRFNQLPKNDIKKFINYIIKKEKIHLTKGQLNSILELYNSDIRSIINYIQSNFNSLKITKILNMDIINKLLNEIKTNTINNKQFYNKIYNIINKYNISFNEFIKKLCIYINTNQNKNININFLNETKYITHNLELNDQIISDYLFCKLKSKLSFNNSSSKK